jgi:CBS domain containing-hemolysin-like protein
MPEESLSLVGASWRLLLTFLFVGINGFFVAAEFALVKVRQTRIEALAEKEVGSAKTTLHILQNLDRYLSACQLGITIASLILGALAEPAVASFVFAGLEAVNVTLAPQLAHGIAITIALSVVTTLHVTLGEQAPKIWAIQNSEPLALRLSLPLRVFTTVFGPAISMLNKMSNGLLRLFGIKSGHEHDGVLSREELSAILVSSAQAGTITPRQREFAENILNMMSLEVRHILVPRIDVARISLRDPHEKNIEKLRNSAHSRLPLCKDDLDSVVGIVHEREVLRALASGEEVKLEALARKHQIVTDTQPIGRFIRELQDTQSHCAVVVDEHGTVIGLAFLEDALEEIVGPIHDEFDVVETYTERTADGSIEMDGDVALPEAEEILGLRDLGEFDTIGGLIVAQLGRVAKKGDELEIGSYDVHVLEVDLNRIERLRFTPK